MSKRSDKMYKNSPKIERDEETGSLGITRGEKKSAEVNSGTADEGVKEEGPAEAEGAGQNDEAMRAQTKTHQKHAKERLALHHKHEKEHLEAALKHAKESGGAEIKKVEKTAKSEE